MVSNQLIAILELSGRKGLGDFLKNCDEVGHQEGRPTYSQSRTSSYCMEWCVDLSSGREGADNRYASKTSCHNLSGCILHLICNTGKAAEWWECC